MLQPQDPVEPAPAVLGGGGPGRGEHRPGSRGHQLGPGRAQAAAGRRVSGLEWTLCTSIRTTLLIFSFRFRFNLPISVRNAFEIDNPIISVLLQTLIITIIGYSLSEEE